MSNSYKWSPAKVATGRLFGPDQRKLRDAGLTVSNDTTIETDPLWTIDADKLSRRGRTGSCVDQATYFSDPSPVPIEPAARQAA
jgi:hypothetical protein